MGIFAPVVTTIAGSMGPQLATGGILSGIGGVSGALELGLGGVSALQMLGQSVGQSSLLNAQAGAQEVSALEASNAGRAQALQAQQAQNIALANTTAAIGAGGGTFEGSAAASFDEVKNITDFNVSNANLDARRAFVSGLAQADRLRLRADSAQASGVGAVVPLAQGIQGAFF